MTGDSKQARHADPPDEAEREARSEVLFRGRVAAPAEERKLPSGDAIATARLIIDRDAAALTGPRSALTRSTAWVGRRGFGAPCEPGPLATECRSRAR